jgi:hypothetical protein
MEFRWVIAITLWTMLSGPVFAIQTTAPRPQAQTVATANCVAATR